MNGHDVIVIGTSAGGLAALKELVRGLPSDLAAAVFIVRSHTTEGLLPSLLQRAAQMKVTHATNREQIQKGCIYVAPPDYHLILEDGRMILSDGPKENRMRPAIDPLFRSAALAYRQRVIGITLNGELDDGTHGLWCIKHHGGVTIVQNPTDTAHLNTPRSALKNVKVDYCLPISEIPPLLVQFVKAPVAETFEGPVDENFEIENRIARGDSDALHEIEKLGNLTALTCPDCHGSLWEIHEGDFIRFRCRAGHAYTGEHLIAEQAESIENLLRAALTATEENPALCRHLGEHAREQGDQLAADHFLSQTAQNERRAHLIQQALTNHERLFLPDESAEWRVLTYV